jgi:hypothetical protein
MRYVFLKYIPGIHSRLTSVGFTFSAENRAGIAGKEQSRREVGENRRVRWITELAQRKAFGHRNPAVGQRELSAARYWLALLIIDY